MDNTRQLLSIYAWDAYAEFAAAAPDAGPHAPIPGAIARCLHAGLAHMQPNGPWLDIGCSVGRSTLEAAQHTSELVLGVDLSFSMLRLAQQVLTQGNAQFALRRVGLVYDDISIETPFADTPNADFWLCDALALPFSAASFNTISMLNVLDCVPSPIDALQAVESLLAPGGEAMLSTPFDWSVSATPVESWLGGHSQRSAAGGSAESMLRSLLAGAHSQALSQLHLKHEITHFPWHTRLHARAAMHYDVHLCMLEKQAV